MARLALLAALLAFTLVSLGPVLDHHFAERQPSHGHLYFGENVPAHQHPYQQAHNHHHLGPGAASAQPESPDDTLYLTNYDGIGLGWPVFTSLMEHIGLAFPAAGDALLLGSSAPGSVFSETAVPPLDRPPLS